ncbi:uncharacterized protein N7500_005450 [Penicillium coprophilum]|uniref:uncharacterized protein n=1 Tax=Penicillium coprophilum TaxID=36646 RepID=UPI0023878A9C|nr:uncharacterized protein N7500_005450 [Penicillium coprophilum]KAJ5163620.1 hypothetical protein N7500_005450 [Penicillium coprophilum]
MALRIAPVHSRFPPSDIVPWTRSTGQTDDRGQLERRCGIRYRPRDTKTLDRGWAAWGGLLYLVG